MGNWETAIKISDQVIKDGIFSNSVCDLWIRLSKDTSFDLTSLSKINNIITNYDCHVK